MKFIKDKIGNIASQIKTGKTPPTKYSKYFDGDINWYTPSDLSKNIYLGSSNRTITKYAIADKKAVVFDKDTVLISCIGDIGKLGITSGQSSSNQQITGIKLNEKVNPLFFYYWCKRNNKKLEKSANQAVVPILNNAKLSKLKISYPKRIKDQIRIATLLSQVEKLIAKRKESIHLLDEMLKSTFRVMFSEYFLSENFKLFGDHIKDLTDYHANGSYEILRNHVELLTTPDFALMVRTTDLENNNFEQDCNYITKEAYNFLSKSKVFGGEIIINKIGSAGRVYLMPHLNRPVSLGMNAFLIRLRSSINNFYIYFLLTSEFGTASIQKHVKGAVTKTITKDAIRKIKIPVPPVVLQKQFANIVNKTESLKTKYQSSLQELENLYLSLSQRAFQGSLDLSSIPVELLSETTTTSQTLATLEVIPKIKKKDAQQKQLDNDLKQVIKKKFKSSFTFNELLDSIMEKLPIDTDTIESEAETQNTEFIQYEKLKSMVFDWLEGKKPFLTQVFDKERKEMVFKLAI